MGGSRKTLFLGASIDILVVLGVTKVSGNDDTAGEAGSISPRSYTRTIVLEKCSSFPRCRSYHLQFPVCHPRQSSVVNLTHKMS